MQFCLINKIEILIKINKLNNIRTSHLSFHITFIVNKYGAFLVSVLETVVSEASLCWRLFGSQCHNLYLNKYEALSCSCVLETLLSAKHHCVGQSLTVNPLFLFGSLSGYIVHTHLGN